MFGSTKTIKKPKEDLKFTIEDVQRSRNYLIRQLRDYLDFDEDDPEHITQVCRIIDSLAKLNEIAIVP